MQVLGPIAASSSSLEEISMTLAPAVRTTAS